MSQHGTVRPEVKIPGQHEQAAFRAIKTYLLNEYHQEHQAEINKLGNLVECFEYLEYSATRKKAYVHIESYGSDNVGHVDDLWGVLARFVSPDSYIEVISDDDADDRIKIKFSKGKLIEVQGRWIYDDEGLAELKKIRG